MTFLYHELVYQPMYNGLIFLMDLLPWADVGVIIILFTILVKLVLFPLSKKSVQTQLMMRGIEPELSALREKYKDDKQEQGRQLMKFYKERGINPFAGIFLVLIQLPIIIALYRIFLHSGLPSIDLSLLYSFIKAPSSDQINMFFLGLVDVSGKNVFLALIAGITTYIQVRFSMPMTPKRTVTPSAKPNFQEDFARSMQLQMRYVFPVIAFFISWSISGAIAIYWITSNLFTIGQELVIRKTVRRREAARTVSAEVVK